MEGRIPEWHTKTYVELNTKIERRINGSQLDGECKNKEEEEDLPKKELEDEKPNEEQTRGGLEKEHELGQSRVQGIARVSDEVDDLMATSFPCLASPRRCFDGERDAQSDHSRSDKKTKKSRVEQPRSHESCRGVQSSSLNFGRANGENYDRDGKQFIGSWIGALLMGTTKFYASKGVRYMQQLDVPDYLKHAEARRHKEHDHCILYMDGSSRKSLVATTEKQLLDRHTHAIMEKGSVVLMDENRNALELLQQALSTYIKITGHGIVMDKVKDKDTISSLLDLKLTLIQYGKKGFSTRGERYVYPTICIHGDFSLEMEPLFAKRCESMLSDQDTSEPPHTIFNVLYGERPNFSKVCGKGGNHLAVSRFVVPKKGRANERHEPHSKSSAPLQINVFSI
eukprot:Gb_19898 [translate_table: standard]